VLHLEIDGGGAGLRHKKSGLRAAFLYD